MGKRKTLDERIAERREWLRRQEQEAVEKGYGDLRDGGQVLELREYWLGADGKMQSRPYRPAK